MKISVIFNVALAVILSSVGHVNAAPPPIAIEKPSKSIPTDDKLFDSILAADTILFDLLFNQCDPQKMSQLVTEDMEFFHDKGGFTDSSGAQFVEGYAKNCKSRGKPDAWRSRRELVRDSMTVYPVPNYGAIQDGYHLFFERKGDGPEKLVGRARFSQVWKWESGKWRIARVLSYAHEAIK